MLGVAVEGVAVDGAAVDGTAVDGVTVDGVALEGVAVVGVGVGASVAPGQVGAGVVGLPEGDGVGPDVGLNATSPSLTRQDVSIASARRSQRGKLRGTFRKLTIVFFCVCTRVIVCACVSPCVARSKVH